MKKLFTVLIFFSFFSINSFAFSPPDSSFNVEISKGKNFKFGIYYLPGDDIIQKLTYYEVNPGERIALAAIIDFTEDDYVHYIEFDDYNFDGYLDMYAHDPCMILGNCFGKVYLYEDGQFNHDPQFDDMTTVTANPENGTIFSSNRSAAGSLFTNETFKWEGDKLILIKRVSQSYAQGYDSQMYEYTIEERDSDGNLVVTKKELVQEPNLE
jgi:hypothetical protein